MCGFVGIYDRISTGDGACAVDAMLEVLMHRGPDGRGTWAEGELALGHVRLSILDLSERAHQPIVSQDGAAVLVYNGEVYNYHELRRELEGAGVRFESSGDTEVVLHALLRWGPERAIPRFNGMFAFAYFDKRDRTLWLARDRLGIKPLYVSEHGSELVFGSEPEAILAHPGIDRRPDRLAIASFIMRGRPDPLSAFYEGITALEPGSWWRIHGGRVQRHRWFHVLEALDVERIINDECTDSVERFEMALDESVRLHLASDVPLATICSGGVDSSLITAVAKRHNPGITSYVADLPFENGEADSAQRTADSISVPLTRVRIEREDFLRLWPEAVLHDGHPCFHRSNVALLALVRKCREDGIKVLLNGEGADELFGGYLWQEIAFLTYDPAARLRRALIPNPLKRRRSRQYFHRVRYRALPGIDGFGNREIAAVDGEGETRRRALLDKLAPIPSRADRVFLARCLDDLYYSLDALLRRHDRMAMSASVEMRVPFIENGLIDLGMHFPRRVKYNRRRSKWVVKKAAEKLLPADIVHATKKAFPVPIAYDLGTESLLRGGASSELLRWTASVERHLIDACRPDPNLRFHLVGLELWARMALGGDKPAQLGDKLLAAVEH